MYEKNALIWVCISVCTINVHLTCINDRRLLLFSCAQWRRHVHHDRSHCMVLDHTEASLAPVTLLETAARSRVLGR